MSTVRAGERGVDFSFARPPALRLIELGYSFVVGYISVPPASPAKNISKAECEVYVAAGIKVLLVWEQSAASPNLGATAGATHGRSAKTLATALGYPVDVPILVADDTNTTAANIVAHEDYVRAFAQACAPYPIGIYGDTDILDRCTGLWRIGWLPNAWSWSGASKAQAEAKARALGAHVLQRKGFYIDNTWAVDPNDAIADFPAWGLTVTPPPAPPIPQPEDDMATAFFEVDGLPGQYMWTPGSKPIPFTNPTDRDVLLKGLLVDPANGGKISQDMYQRLFPALTDADALAVKVAALIQVPPLTGHIAADLGAGGHITGSVG